MISSRRYSLLWVSIVTPKIGVSVQVPVMATETQPKPSVMGIHAQLRARVEHYPQVSLRMVVMTNVGEACISWVASHCSTSISWYLVSFLLAVAAKMIV